MILRKIIKTAATRCHISKAKMHQIRFRLGLRPRPAGGAYSAPPDPLAGLNGSTFKERGGEVRGGQGTRSEGSGRERMEDKGGQGKWTEREREGREGKG